MAETQLPAGLQGMLAAKLRITASLYVRIMHWGYLHIDESNNNERNNEIITNVAFTNIKSCSHVHYPSRKTLLLLLLMFFSHY